MQGAADPAHRRGQVEGDRTLKDGTWAIPVGLGGEDTLFEQRIEAANRPRSARSNTWSSTSGVSAANRPERNRASSADPRSRYVGLWEACRSRSTGPWALASRALVQCRHPPIQADELLAQGVKFRAEAHEVAPNRLGHLVVGVDDVAENPAKVRLGLIDRTERRIDAFSSRW